MRAALDQLLRGTNLTASMRGGVVVLTPARAVAAPRRIVHAGAAKPIAQAIAQAEPETPRPQEESEIIVSGYRESLTAAQALKR
ncbi:STN domain-containing protein, partial [Escherichia coli]|nr:STN domain-containing protein [Escherichia coli]